MKYTRMQIAGTNFTSGSPVGRWTGYFLLQHKEKLGGNRFISKMRLFKPADAALPYLIFYVNPRPTAGGSTADTALRAVGEAEAGRKRLIAKNTARIVRKSVDGRDVLRKHFIHAHS